MPKCATGPGSAERDEQILVRVDTDQGSFACDEGGDAGNGTHEWTGRVTTVARAEFELDSCAVDGGCVHEKVTIRTATRAGGSVTAPNGTSALDLTRALAPGDDIEVTLTKTNLFQCQAELIVRIAPSLTNAADAALSPGVLLLAVQEGGARVPPPLSLERELLCAYADASVLAVQQPNPMGPLQVAPGQYALRLGSQGNDSSTLVSMGQSATLTVPEGSNQRAYRMYNARSYQLDAFDAYWDWAFWVQLER